MSSIWQNDGAGWHLATPSGYDREATLHDLVELSPQVLPLAGSPNLVIVGREVRLGSGIADLIAIEDTGRPVIIEVKLSSNAEARRAVVTQILTYAAYLHGLRASDFEESVLGRHLPERGFANLLEAAASIDQVGGLEPIDFRATLDESLEQGSFRLVIVLDDAPRELMELVGYLGVVADRIVIDLVTVAQYRVGESTILVPQRIEPERLSNSEGEVDRGTHRKADTYLAPGADDFTARIEQAPTDQQPILRALAEWATTLDARGLVRLSTYHGKGDRRLTLLPRLQPDGVGLVTIWNDNGTAGLQFWRSVFERRAPRALKEVERLSGSTPVAQGNTTRTISPDLLSALTRAYEEAASAPFPH